jgi:hypothetical protein
MPIITKTNENPKKKINVIHVIFFFSLKVYEKYAGKKGKMHGDNIPSIPAINAMKNEILTAKSAVTWLLYSIIFCKPIGSSDWAETEAERTNITIKNKKALFISTHSVFFYKPQYPFVSSSYCLFSSLTNTPILKIIKDK